MYCKCRVFIIVAIICSAYNVFANKSDHCDCDILQVEGPNADGFIGFQNFTKQTSILNGKPYFFSTQRNMIVWYNQYWSYDKYNGRLKTWEGTKIRCPMSTYFQETKN